MVSGVSILTFSTLRKRLSLLRSSIGLHLLFDLMTELCFGLQVKDLCLSFAAALLQKVQEKQQLSLQSLYFFEQGLKSVRTLVRSDSPVHHCKVPVLCAGPPGTDDLNIDCHLKEL